MNTEYTVAHWLVDFVYSTDRVERITRHIMQHSGCQKARGYVKNETLLLTTPMLVLENHLKLVFQNATMQDTNSTIPDFAGLCRKYE